MGATIPCTAMDTAAALNGVNQYSAYGAVAGLNNAATRATRGAISLSNSNHFPPHRGLHSDETSDVSSGPRKTCDEAASDRVGKEPENDGNGARLLQQHSGSWRALRKNKVGLQRDEFLGESLHQLLVQLRPAIVDPNV